jgi:hypothetical protein
MEKVRLEGYSVEDVLELVDAERVTREEALSKSRKTRMVNPDVRVNLSVCPACSLDAFQTEKARQVELGEHDLPLSIFQNRVHKAQGRKEKGGPGKRPWSIKEGNDG